MNYIEYKKHVEEHNLIESPESVQCLVNAIQINKNIKSIKSLNHAELAMYSSFDLDPKELLAKFEEEKDQYIKLAIKQCYPADWAIQMFGTSYRYQVNELKANMKPTVASLGVSDIKHQGGV